MAFLSENQLKEVGFKSLGNNVLISERAAVYGAKYISIGDNTRIDDFCILSAGSRGIFIGSHVHMACYSSIIGRGEVFIADYANISSRVSVYSSSDDFSGNYMTNPTIASEYTNVKEESVCINKHVIIGSGSVVLPGVNLGEGVAIGALSLVNNNCEAYGIFAGTPIKYIKERSKKFLDIEKKFKDE